MLGLMQMTPGVKALLTIVVVCTLGSWILGAAAGVNTIAYVAFLGEEFNKGALWQCLTYPFFYPVGALIPWLFDSLLLWVFGNTVEQRIGTRRFYRMFLLAGLFAAGAACATTALGLPINLFGMSVPVSAIMIVFCIMHSEEVLNLWLIVIIPIKGKYLGLIFALFDIAYHPTMVPAYAAALAGAYLVAVKNWWPPVAAVPKKKKTAASQLRAMPPSGEKVVPIRPRFTESNLEVEVDRILDKLRVEGMANLTPQEKETLDRHSRNMRDQDR